MGVHLLGVCTILALGIVTPVKYHYTGDWSGNVSALNTEFSGAHKKETGGLPTRNSHYLSFCIVFVYAFSVIVAYFLIHTSKYITEKRQSYLARQSTVTDSTVKIEGIPRDLQDETRLQEFVEALQIGTVRRVTICKNWMSLDKLLYERKDCLRRLEIAWTEYEGGVQGARANYRHIVSNGQRVRAHTRVPSTASRHIILTDERRPQVRTGMLGLFGPKVDAIDLYTEELEILDQRIQECRQKRFASTAMGFVTFSSVASAQMAAQAVLDPKPLQLVASLAPAPHELIWENTYQTHTERFIRNWTFTLVTAAVAILWSLPLSFIAPLLDIQTIRKFLPVIARALESTSLGQSIVQSFLPTLAYTAFNGASPFIFQWISERQGYLSLGERELSLVSKYFFYLFYNFFFFIAIGTLGSLYAIAKDTTQLAYKLAKVLPTFSQFYLDLIILQGIGMLPLKLLQFGSVVSYPIFRVGCKTPRDFADLLQRPNFNFGFLLPQPIFVLIICLCYSIFSPWIILIGLIYFSIGTTVYKYQLLYCKSSLSYLLLPPFFILFFFIFFFFFFERERERERDKHHFES